MRRAIYGCVLLIVFFGGATIAAWMLLYAVSFKVWMFFGPVFFSIFAAYLLWDDFLKPWLTGKPPRS